MVHNGIGYGVMAANAEGLNILRNANIGKRDRQHLPEHDAETTPLRDPELYQFDMNLPEIAEVWRRGSVIGSWLLDLTASALLEDPGLTQDGGRVSDSGEGRWTIQASIDEGDLSLLQMSAFLIDDPFADRLYPSALAVIERLETFRTTVILSDGDVVFQPRKVVRSGLWDAVSGRVLIYIHKQQMQGAVQRHHPARHDVMVDDKLRILAAIKQVMEDRLTTVFPRQGHYALDPAVIAAYPPADFSIERIGDLLDADTRSLCAPPGEMMNHEMNINTRKLHDLGQRIWLDNITREKLNNGKLARYIAELSVTGLTSNPTTFEHAIGSGNLYDAEIQKLVAEVLPSEDIFFELALQDLTQAADLFRPTFDASSGGDGGVSLEVSPLLANDSAGTIQAAARLHARAARPKLFIKIPGTPEGLPAIEQSIFNGVPINVTLLFSRQHYVAAAQAYLRGIERRLKAGLDSRIESVASLFVSRWDAVVKEDVQPQLHSCLGIAIAMRTYMAHCGLLASERWQRLAAAGARPQRLLWASTGAKDPASPDTLYVEAHVAAQPIDTIPEKTLLAFADHGKLGATLLADGGAAESVLNEFKRDGVDDKALAARLQQEGVQAFAKSWSALMARIREKSLQPAAKAERAGTA